MKHTAGFSSQDKRLPSWVFDLAPSLKEKFLGALIEGDGYYDPGHRRFGFFTRSKRLLAGVGLLLASLGYHFVLSRKDPRTGVYGLFYYPEPRKPWPQKGDFVAVPVYEITEEDYPHEWEYDLSVDCETENFVGGLGGLLFHNTPFTNLTFDLKCPETLRNYKVLLGGKEREETYAEFQEEMNLINRAFCELMLAGDARGRIFTFPIPTYNITRDFDYENPELEPLWEMTRKYGIPYFANFVNSDMRPEDARSMCCRLRLDNRELERRGGGLFGASPLTGSIGVVTINLPRLAYLSTCEEEFFERLTELMELAKTSLEIKRKVIEDFTARGLYPYSRVYLQPVKECTGQYWRNHFSTIGILGMNEACLNFLGVPIYHPEGKEWAIKVLKFMREKLADFQEETGNLYNLEATPAEGASYRLARLDKKKFPRIKTAGTPEVPYYTNSVHLPVGYTDDIFEILSHQDDLQVLFTGGTVVHLFVGEEIPDTRMVKELVRAVVTHFRLPYFSITPTFSVCPVHGYLPGKHEICPYPHSEEELARYGRELELALEALRGLPPEAYRLVEPSGESENRTEEVQYEKV
ncbi:ribonucleoside triphosphate reductase [Thermosulfurimonas marina]|uniref:Ribonucleoside triphosphate reductase n=2 Tax=Thermosulfurimonas marina TaxID=2047767 RepID=A0A6H1WUU5_9BACT|nr:ribonucleoside triphosphate reductase [Thermosulfurimonas marina]